MMDQIGSDHGVQNEGSDNDSTEGSSEDVDQITPVAAAIINRIMNRHLSLLSQHGPEKVLAAVEMVADYAGDVDEVGSSDVSGWVKQVEQELSGMNEAAIAELQTLSGMTRVDPRDPNAITKTALAKQGITTGADPRTGAMTVSKGVNKQQVLAVLKGITAKSKGKINPSVVMNSGEDQSEPVMEKEIRINKTDDQDSDGDTDFADIMIARKVKSGQPKDKAIDSTRDKSYNEVDMHESNMVGESIALLKKLSGL